MDATDSVLEPYAKGAQGMTIRYDALIKRAFLSQFWSSTQLSPDGFRQIEQNFSLFWGLAVIMYESTLVSDQTPFDQYVSGNISAMTPQQVAGFQVFVGNGGCIFCHRGPEFTGAATELKFLQSEGGLIEHMLITLAASPGQNFVPNTNVTLTGTATGVPGLTRMHLCRPPGRLRR